VGGISIFVPITGEVNDDGRQRKLQYSNYGLPHTQILDSVRGV